MNISKMILLFLICMSVAFAVSSTEAIGLILSKDSTERGKARLKRSGLNEVGMAIAMADEEDRSGEAIAGRTLDKIKPIASTETLDVETLPSLRSQQYSMGPYKKIVVFSAPRTGSSLIYNVFRFLFEEDSKIYLEHHCFENGRCVLKTHRYAEADSLENEENVLYVFTIRNPFSASVSNYRICSRKIFNKRTYAEKLVNRHLDTLLFSENKESTGKKVLRLYYEDFADNVNVLFDFIEYHFSLTISDEDKYLMRLGYSRENISRCTAHLADFNQFLPRSGFHGQHVSLEEYSPPKEFLYWLEKCVDNVKIYFEKYGYFSETI
jgi:hypothetical protein